MGNFNRTLIQFARYDSASTTTTMLFPIAFSQVPKIASNCSSRYTSAITAHYFPYDITETGFTRAKTNSTLWMDYIAIGY